MPDPSSPISLLFWLVVAHQLMDFALQTTPIAVEKNRHSTTALQQDVPWFYWLTAHALLHGGAVALITKSVGFGLLETVIHWLVDFAKCEKWTNIHQDQAIHYVCKVIWVILITNGVTLAV